MVIFKAGSTHTLKLGIHLPKDYKLEEDDFPISFWLTDSKGKSYSVLTDQIVSGKEIFCKVYHLTKTRQELEFKMIMPDVAGDYTLSSNLISSMFETDPGRLIKLT